MTPTSILLLAELGFFTTLKPRWWRNSLTSRYLSPCSVAGLFSISAVTWIALRMFGLIPGHDGLRQLSVVSAAMAILAGQGAFMLSFHHLTRGWIAKFLVIACLFPAAWETLRIYCRGPLLGGAPEAKRLGFESTYYWDAATDDTIDWLNENLPEGATVVIFPPPDVRVFRDWRRFGRLRPDLRFENYDEQWDKILGEPGAYVIFQLRQGLYMPRGASMGLFARLAESTALYEVKPPAVGVRLLAVFSPEQMRDFLRAEALRLQTEAGK
jgi:hypothetical protein